jgi:Transcription factor WhiB
MTSKTADPKHPPPVVHPLAEQLPDLDNAACVDHPYASPHFWTGGASWRNQQLAKAICKNCVVLAACRTWALGPSGTVMPGVLGGLSASERRQIRHDRKVAR